LVGSGVDIGFGVLLDRTSFVGEGRGVSVTGVAEGKGVMGCVWAGFGVAVAEIVGLLSGVLWEHPDKKITNKVNMTTLDEFNGINRPFVTL
jgi:hypothetical protein